MEHFYDSIGGWFNFQDFYRQQVENAADGAHFVEIGAWKGRSAAYMAVEIINSGKQIRFDVIDTWQGSGAEHDHDQDLKDGRLYEVFLENMQPVADHYRALRMTSVAASDLYEPGSLDMVFIDGAHDYDSVLADVRAWWPKVRPGGVIGGDDWAHGPVQQAVREALADQTIEQAGGGWPWWVVRKNPDLAADQ